jgi:hypothetical protein
MPSMPTGDSPDKAHDYYLYLQSHHQSDGRIATWHVDWFSLTWFWGFVIALVVAVLFWVKQYRTTRQRTGLYPLDSFGGWTSEAAGPATGFFLLLTAIIVGFGFAIIVGHLIWGQKF